MIDWNGILEVLKQKVEAGDFSFLDQFELSPRLREGMEQALRYAVLQEQFPQMQSLNKYAELQGIAPWILKDLKENKGLLENPEKGTWRLAPKTAGAIIPEPKMPKKAANQQLPEQQQKLWNYINRERVGDEMRFTVNHARVAKEEVGTSDTYIWDMLRSFEKKGLFERKVLKKGQGLLLVFDSGKKAPGRAEAPEGIPILTPGQITIAQYRQMLGSEIEKTKAEIEKLENKAQEKRQYLEERKRILEVISKDFPQD